MLSRDNFILEKKRQLSGPNMLKIETRLYHIVKVKQHDDTS